MRKFFFALCALLGFVSQAEADCPYTPGFSTAINPWYWSVTGSSPGTQVWNGNTGAFVVLADATYVAWVALGCTATTIDTAASLNKVIDDYNSVHTSLYFGLNNQTGLTADYAIPNPFKTTQNIQFTTTLWTLKLPQANLFGSIPIGMQVTIFEASSGALFNLKAYDGSALSGDVVYNTTLFGSIITAVLTANDTAQGTWTIRQVGPIASTSWTSYGVLLSSGATVPGAIASTTNMSSGYLLVGQTGLVAPIPVALSGDATLVASGALTLASTISAGGPTGSATVTPIITYDAKGRLTTVSSATIAPPFSAVTGSLACSQHPALTGDVTTSAGNCATTLAAGSASNLNSGTLPAGRLPALTGDVTSSAGSAATTLAAGSASNLNSGTLLAARMPALTGDVTTSAGAVATTIAANAVTNAKAAQMAANTIKANNTGSTANAADVTPGALGAMLCVPTITILTASSGTYTTSTCNSVAARYLIIEGVGGGGGGGGSGTTPGAATAGGDTCWNTSGAACTSFVYKAAGGPLGVSNPGAVCTAATASGADLNISGGRGGPSSNTAVTGGDGANAPFYGGGGSGGGAAGGPGAAGSAAGAGGGGGAWNGATQTGGGGCSGAYFMKLLTSPAATYTYAIGAAGAGGTAGTSGTAGGAGVAGQIVVKAFFQ